MATGYWRIKTNGNNFELYDHLPLQRTRSSLTVKITVPGLTEEALLTAADQSALTAKGIGLYTLAIPSRDPLIVEPGDVTAETGSTFRDGVYKFYVSFTATVSGSATSHVFEEHVLYTPVIDAAISTKLDAYLASSCDKCKNTKQLNTLQELVSLRQGTQLDINAGRITEAGLKVTLMSNISTGASCTCVCGC